PRVERHRLLVMRSSLGKSPDSAQDQSQTFTGLRTFWFQRYGPLVGPDGPVPFPLRRQTFALLVERHAEVVAHLLIVGVELQRSLEMCDGLRDFAQLQQRHAEVVV